jgi:hypothetical protein
MVIYQVLERSHQVENLFVILFYPLVQIMFDDSQSYVDLFICLNLVVPSIEHLGKFIENIIKVVIHKIVPPSWSRVFQRPLEVCNYYTFLNNIIDFYHLFKHMHMYI